MNCSKRFDLIVTVEEHNIVGGFGSAISEVIAESHSVKSRVLRIGIDDKYSSIVGSQKYLREVYGMSAMAITQKVIESLGEV